MKRRPARVIQAQLAWQAGVLARVEVSGHAPKLATELCVATSTLLRSSAQALQSLEFDWQLEIPREGEFAWQLRSWPQKLQGCLEGISLVLASGLRQLARDYPALKLREEAAKIIGRPIGGKQYGT